MELKYYTILTSPNYNNPSLLVKDWNKENYPFGFDGVNHDGTECIWAQEQEVYIKKDVDEAIAELKGCLASAEEDRDYFKNVRNERHEEEIAELKQKLENVQASMYCDVVDANMENRKLRRELWIARAKRAIEKIAWFKLWNSSISTMNPEDGARQEFDKWKKSLGKFLKKAEEYK